MVPPAAGKVVLVPLPFSDLSRSKLRPAIVVAHAGRGDWVLCQMTSNPYADPRAVKLTHDSIAKGSLHIESFARPGKLFTVSAALMVKEAGVSRNSVTEKIVDAIVEMLRIAGRR